MAQSVEAADRRRPNPSPGRLTASHVDNSKKRAARHPLSESLASPLGLAGGSRLPAVVGVARVATVNPVGLNVATVNPVGVNMSGVGWGGVVGFGG